VNYHRLQKMSEDCETVCDVQLKAGEVAITLNVMKYDNLYRGQCWSVKHILPKSKVSKLSDLEQYMKSMRLLDHHTEKSNYPNGYTFPELFCFGGNHYVFYSYLGEKPELSILSPVPLIRTHKCYTIHLT